MKKFKRFMAVLLSAVLLMSIAPLSVFAESIPDELTFDYSDWSEVYKYCKELKVGSNSFTNIDDETIYFCSFVPQKTGVYSFNRGAWGITADTNDNICSYDELEETLTLFSYSNTELIDLDSFSIASLYGFLTAGTRYFVLFNYLSNVDVTYCGTVTDVNLAEPLTDLVAGLDVFGYDSFLEVDADFEITFSNNTVAHCFGYCFSEGFYTDDTLTWTSLGFEKTINYHTIDISEMIDSITVTKNVNIIRYFDESVKLQKPVTAVIKFTNGESTKVYIDNYYESYDFIGTNGRTYNITLYIRENDSVWIGLPGFEVETGCTVKRAGFFKNLSYYISSKAEIRALYNDIILEGNYTGAEKRELIKTCNQEIRALRIEFIKSIFSFK